jgi:uncharacterized protein YkwD
MTRPLSRRSPLAAAIAALLALAVAPSGAAASDCANAGSDLGSISIKQAQRSTLCLLNGVRRAHGLRALSRNDKLDLASRRHAKDMVANKYFAHGDFAGRIRATNYLAGARSWYIGENIAWGTGSFGTPAGIVNSWMNSPPHRHNILLPNFQEIGIGIARGVPRPGLSGGGTYVTDFGTRG